MEGSGTAPHTPNHNSRRMSGVYTLQQRYVMYRGPGTH
jgi:hypothetical protein